MANMQRLRKQKPIAEQSARFIEAAKKTSADESVKAFERALQKVLKGEKPKPAKS